MNRQRRGVRRVAPFALALLLTGSLAACGDDDDDEATDTTEAEETTTTAAEGEQAAGSAEEFCTAAVEAETALAVGPDVDFENASEEEIQQALAAFGDEVDPILTAAQDAAPEEIADDVDTLVGFFQEGLQTGDDTFFEDPEFIEAETALDDYMLDNCDYPVVGVTAVDYAFQGVPDSIEAGVQAFDFSNEGEEEHEMVLVRINEDTTESLEELLDLPEEEAMQKVTFIGGGFASPGESDVAFFDLEAGDYGMVCFVPVGSTGEEGGDETTTTAADGEETTTTGGEGGEGEEGEDGEEGPPHFTQGMFAQFTVS